MQQVYSYQERSDSCAFVLHMALGRLAHGVFFEETKQERRHKLRVIHSGEGNVHGYLDHPAESVGDAVEIHFQRSSDAFSLVQVSPEHDDRSPALTAELEAAVHQGSV